MFLGDREKALVCLWGKQVYEVRHSSRRFNLSLIHIFYTTVEDRAWSEVRDPQGRVVGRTKGFGGMRSNAEFQFHHLYEVAKKTFQHYLDLLRQLRQISILDPPVSPIE